MESDVQSVLIGNANHLLEQVTGMLSSVLFYPIFGVPFLVLWLIVAGVFFTIRFGFINVRLFGHALNVARGKYTRKDEPGEVTHFQALTAAVSATVGLGNIAGVAVAVSVGGPGAVVWMALFGLLGMSTKFAEVFMGQKYREFDEHGRVSGGAFHYLKKGLAEKGWPALGAGLAVVFAVLCFFGSLGGGNMFQANQAVKILTHSFPALKDADWAIALVLAVSVGFILLGGIKRIAAIASKVVPLMAAIYLLAAFVVIGIHWADVPSALGTMFGLAFGASALGGGAVGAIIAGAQRAAFSNEAGMGSAPIAHAAAKSNDPMKEGCVALLEPFIDTVIICFVTGLMITVTGVYQGAYVSDGVLITSAAFDTVAPWFSMVLAVAVVLFAFSTMMTWSYYGERAWGYLFGYRPKVLNIYHLIFASMTFIGGVSSLGVIIELSDLMLLSMALPNLLGLYLMSDDIAREVDNYITKLKSGKMKMIRR